MTVLRRASVETKQPEVFIASRTMSKAHSTNDGDLVNALTFDAALGSSSVFSLLCVTFSVCVFVRFYFRNVEF